MVLLELLTGRPAVDGSRPNGCQLLAHWLQPSLSSVTRLWVSLHSLPALVILHKTLAEVDKAPPPFVSWAIVCSCKKGLRPLYMGFGVPGR